MSTPASRSTRSDCAWTSSRPLPLWAKDSSTPCADAKAANRSTHPLTSSLTSVRFTPSGCGGSSSARANQSKSSTILLSRWLSRLTLWRTSRYSEGSRGRSSAMSISASITEMGVRSSWEASAVNSACRRRTNSEGADARRPTTVAPPNTTTAKMAPNTSSATRSADWTLEIEAALWPTTSNPPRTGSVSNRTFEVPTASVTGFASQ